MSRTYGVFARGSQLKASAAKDGNFGQDFLDKLLGATATAVVAPIAQRITGGVSEFFNQPYEKNERAWQKAAEKAREENVVARGRGHDFFDMHKLNYQATGSDDGAARKYTESIINQNLQDMLAKGETTYHLPIEGTEYTDPVSVNLKDMDEKAYAVLVGNLADAKLDANDGKFRKQYMKILNLTRGYSKEEDSEKKARIQKHSKLATGYIGSLSNIIRGQSEEELINESLNSLKNSKRFQDDLALLNAFKNFDETKTLDNANAVLTQAFVNEELSKLAIENFENQSATPGTSTYRNDDGNLVTRDGMFVRTYNTITGKTTVDFQGTGEEIPTTVDRTLFKSKYDSIGPSLTAIQTGTLYSKDKGRTFVANLAEKHNLDIFNLQQYVGAKGFADENGRKKLEDTAKSISLEIFNFRNNKQNFVPTFSESRKKAITDFYKGWAATEASYRSKLAKQYADDDAIEPDFEVIEELVEEHKLAALKYTENLVAIENGLVDIDRKGNPIAVGWKLNEENVPEPDKEAGLTRGELEVNAAVFKLWETERKVLSLEKKEIIRKTVEAEEAVEVVDSEDTNEQGKPPPKFNTDNQNIMYNTVEKKFEEKGPTKTEKKPKEETTEEIMASAFPVNNVDVDKVFPSVIRQQIRYRERAIENIRNEVHTPSDAKSRLGKVLHRTGKYLAKPFQEIYYNALSPWGELSNAARLQITQEIGGIWGASTEDLNNKSVSFIHRANQIHTVLELKAERPDFTTEINEAAKKLLKINPKIETEKLKQGIANLIFSPSETSLLEQQNSNSNNKIGEN